MTENGTYVIVVVAIAPVAPKFFQSVLLTRRLRKCLLSEDGPQKAKIRKTESRSENQQQNANAEKVTKTQPPSENSVFSNQNRPQTPTKIRKNTHQPLFASQQPQTFQEDTKPFVANQQPQMNTKIREATVLKEVR